jgi:hypothetical protein
MSQLMRQMAVISRRNAGVISCRHGTSISCPPCPRAAGTFPQLKGITIDRLAQPYASMGKCTPPIHAPSARAFAIRAAGDRAVA